MLTQILSRLMLTVFCVVSLCAWTVGTQPVDEGTIEINSCTASVEFFEERDAIYKKANAPESCQGWGLTWHGYWSGNDDANAKSLSNVGYEDPDNKVHAWHKILQLADPLQDGATRLPTIKELLRIFDFNDGSDAAVPASDHVLRAWLQAEAENVAILDGYLISSTYRHINSEAGNDGEMTSGGRKRIRYLGIHIDTGQVVAFNEKLKLCNDLDTDGSCLTSEIKSVYAILVSE